MKKSDLEKGLTARNIAIIGQTYYFVQRRPKHIKSGPAVLKRTLDTQNLATALERAVSLRADMRAGRIAERIAEDRGEATVGDILAAYAEYYPSADIRTRTAKEYISTAKMMLRWKHPTKLLETLPSSVFCEELAVDWAAHRLAAAQSLTPAQRNRVKIARSREIAKVRAIFAPHVLQSQWFRGLTLDREAIESFRQVRIRDSGKSSRFHLPDDVVLSRFREELPKLKERSLAQWLGIQLCLNVGLRASEAAAAHTSQFVTRTLNRVIDGQTVACTEHVMVWRESDTISCKGSQGEATIDPTVFREIQGAIDWIGPVIPEKTLTARKKVLEANCRWLRKLGWVAQRPNHELRKWYGARIATATGSIHTAMLNLRQSDIKVTTDTYADYLAEVRILPA